MAHIEKKSDDQAKTEAADNLSDSRIKDIPISDGEPDSTLSQAAASEEQLKAAAEPDPMQVLETTLSTEDSA